MVTIQFPDPHFKNKHKKRRVVNPALVDTIVRHLAPGKHVFVQSGEHHPYLGPYLSPYLGPGETRLRAVRSAPHAKSPLGGLGGGLGAAVRGVRLTRVFCVLCSLLLLPLLLLLLLLLVRADVLDVLEDMVQNLEAHPGLQIGALAGRSIPLYSLFLAPLSRLSLSTHSHSHTSYAFLTPLSLIISVVSLSRLSLPHCGWPVEGYSRAKLEDNKSPNPVLTEREVATYNKGLPVYRMLFRRV